MKLADFLAHERMGFFASWHPVLRLPGLDIGLAYHAAPSGDTVKPTNFQLNIGHIKAVDEQSSVEREHIGTEMIEMMTDLCERGDTGLVGMLQCEFDGEKLFSSAVQQFNLSVWKDQVCPCKPSSVPQVLMQISCQLDVSKRLINYVV